MELRSNPEMLCVVRNALGQLAATLGFSEPECNAVVLAVDEALTNIIRHAYLGDVRPGGLGLHFIRQSMDTVEFSRRNGRNQLRLVKILHVHGPQKGS